MEVSELERYYDKFIENDDSSRTKEENSEDTDCSFLQLLPDELLTMDGSKQENETAEDDTRDVASSSFDYSSQNPTAAEAAEFTSSDSSSLLDSDDVADSPTPDEQELQQVAPEIQNVISTVRLGCSLDLNLIASKSWNVEYNPKIFKALIMRIREPRATASIYKSGYLVCTGAKSVEQSLLAARKFARIVQKLGFPIRSLNIKIQNMMATCSTFPVRLNQLAMTHHQYCSFEPELFPGLFYKVCPGINVTIFSSGKINICGAKRLDQVYEAFDVIYPILSNFRRW